MPEGFGFLEALISAFGTLWAVVFVGQKTGKIKVPGSALNEQLISSLASISNTMAAIADGMEKMNEKVDGMNVGIAQLVKQHGPPASEGELESWKLSSDDRRDIKAAARKAHNASTMAAVILELVAADTDEAKAEARGQMKRALDDWNATRREFT